MVDFIPPLVPEQPPAPLATTVSLGPLMAGFGSPFDHVDGQNRDMILEAIRTWARNDLRDWTEKWQSHLTEEQTRTVQWLNSWAESTVTYVTNETAEALAAVVGNSVSLQDPVMAALVGNAASAVTGVLTGTYLVYRLWNGTSYPPRITGATNVWIGGPHPGLLMPATDIYVPPGDAVVAAVVEGILSAGSTLNQAVRKVATEIAAVQIFPTVTSSSTAVTIGEDPNQVYGYSLAADGVTNSVRYGGVIPSGWTRARLHAVWMHQAGSGQIRIARSARQFDGDGIQANDSTTANHTSVGVMRANDSSFTFDCEGGRHVSGTIARLSGSTGNDTLAAPIVITDAYLERVA